MTERLRPLSIESLETRQLLAAIFGHIGDKACTAERNIAVEEVSFAVEAKKIHGLRGAELHFRFDGTSLNVDRTSVKAGAAWQGKSNLIANVDNAAGTIDVFVYSTHPITSTSGELVEFDAAVVDRIAGDVSAQLELTEFAFNEGQIQPSSVWLAVEADDRGISKLAKQQSR